MESAMKLVVGLVLMGISLAYLYRPTVVLRVNAWGRMLLFNDAHLLHFRRRWGLLAFLGSILFLYSGFLNLSQSIPLEPVQDPLESGYMAFYGKNMRGPPRSRCGISTTIPGILTANFFYGRRTPRLGVSNTPPDQTFPLVGSRAPSSRPGATSPSFPGGMGR